MIVVYLHGFASGPKSRKARFFRERLEAEGVQVEVPDLSEGDFENLTISGQMRVIERLVEGKTVTLIGSSLGGYLAALFAARNPNAVDRLVLLAPAFEFAERWPVLIGEDGMDRWKATGSLPVFHYGEQRYLDLGVAMLEDAGQWEGAPAFTQPALLFHGARDAVVPLQSSRAFAAGNPGTKLIELETDHEMLNVLPEIWNGSRDFLLT